MCNKTHAGDFTYFKGYKNSQIGFVYTDRIGIKHFKTFDIVEIESSEHVITPC